jgi:hypothetical protein
MGGAGAASRRINVDRFKINQGRSSAGSIWMKRPEQ